MKGICTYDEFKNHIKNGWEIVFNVEGKEFYYERLSLGKTSTAHLSYLDAKSPFFNKQFNDSDEMLEEILALKIVGEKTIVDLEEDIEVTKLVM
ncbi:MAG: hypothetical protein E7003_05555 [Eggerthellaceae bacterium]|nr:hypothetical protein [Eggerthellaceae bacterium]